MNGFAFFSLFTGFLQLIVPSYALRLVRRFGANRVGWFLVAAFTSLAVLHLVEPLKPSRGVATFGVRIELIFAVASVLLLIGMSHLETLLVERQQAQGKEQQLRNELELQVQERTAGLADANTELLQEIARREQKEQLLKESEAQYRFLFTENPQPMWIFELSSLRFLAVNRAALLQYGFAPDEFTDLAAQELVPADAVEAFLQEAARPCTGVESRGVWRHCRKDLTQIDVEVTAVDLKFAGCTARLMVANDVSHRRRRDLELRQEQKAETIGNLAGDFAQHFDNLLTLIEGQANFLLGNLQYSKTADHLKQISSAATRATGLTRQLHTVGGRQPCHPESMDLNEFIQKSSGTLHRLVDQGIALRSALSSNLPPILADPRLLEHVLVNLVLNARDAMPSGGTLTIQTAAVRVDKTWTQRQPEAKPGEFVRLAIRDTGVGIPPEVQARLFEPFVTTRAGAGAAGLGLASVWGVVKQQSGWIEFTTEIGAGTEFAVFFPCAAPPEASARHESRLATPMKRGTVLLVEGEDQARELARYVLNRQGYHVIEADRGETALLLWESQASKVDLVVTDTVPSGISGRELVKRLRHARPELRAVYTSARPSGNGGLDPASLEGEAFISKPYTSAGLLQAVQAAWPKSSAPS